MDAYRYELLCKIQKCAESAHNPHLVHDYLIHLEEATEITRDDVARMNPFLQVQPMEDGRSYLYMDVLIVSAGGWWTGLAVTDEQAIRFSTATLDDMLRGINVYTSTLLAHRAVEAVARGFSS